MRVSAQRASTADSVSDQRARNTIAHLKTITTQPIQRQRIWIKTKKEERKKEDKDKENKNEKRFLYLRLFQEVFFLPHLPCRHGAVSTGRPCLCLIFPSPLVILLIQQSRRPFWCTGFDKDKGPKTMIMTRDEDIRQRENDKDKDKDMTMTKT